MKFNFRQFAMASMVAILSISTSCDDGHSDHDGHDHGKEQKKHAVDDGHGHGEESHGEQDGHDHEKEGVHLKKEQIESIGLEFGALSSIKVNDYVKATGLLGLPPNAYSAVTAKSSGIISGNKKFVEGDYVKKGETIAFIENREFITLQQQYLETKASYELKKLDLSRQQTLVEANAGVSRNLQTAESEADILEAKLAGISKELAYLGISSTNLKPSSITQKIAIVAPMSGYIAAIHLKNGMYADPNKPLMEIIATDHQHLELDVFERDIDKIRVGQKINYTIPAFGSKIYEGTVSVIGKEFNSTSKTIRIHGHLEGEKPSFYKDLYLNAKIWMNDNATNAVPESAVISDGARSFIYIANPATGVDEIEFKEIPVITGATNEGFTAIKLLEEIPEGMKIVIKGAYYVYAQSKAGELEHEH